MLGLGGTVVEERMNLHLEVKEGKIVVGDLDVQFDGQPCRCAGHGNAHLLDQWQYVSYLPLTHWPNWKDMAPIVLLSCACLSPMVCNE